MPAEATEMLGSAAYLPSVQREDTMQLSEEEEVNHTSRWREFLERLSIPAGQLALAMSPIDQKQLIRHMMPEFISTSLFPSNVLH